MIELPLVFVAGLLGSSHCLGMCGPFALTIGSTSPGVAANLRRQLSYSAGRIFTYTVFGAVAGFCGWRLSGASAWLVNVPAVLAVIAGLLLIYQGLTSAGVFTRRATPANSGPCLAKSFFASFLTAPGLRNAFLAGLFTGMLPCGLLYGFVALAASSANMLVGGLTMAVFAAGTIPLMVLAGCGGSLLSLTARRHLLRIAAWCVVLAGIVSVVRGLGFVEIPGLFDATGCPLCQNLTDV